MRIRQDYNKIYDCRLSMESHNTYYTGSRAEGLVLPGSDNDFMHDINNRNDIEVIKTEQDARGLRHQNIFLMLTEKVPPCFAMLRSVSRIQNREIFDACQDMNSSLYISSYLFVHNISSKLSKSFPGMKIARQGPSIEQWCFYQNKSESGQDTVYSIHCPFWPDAATEWRTRARRFSWPSYNDIKTIIDFGFHLVPVGHPHSDTNMMEWRISFSVAERTLVWSFNHVQIQCYAILKLILKEFINPHCYPLCRVLCSYFIKTFLFWEYEETDLSYWCTENFRDCILHLLSKFMECIRTKSLRHYFIQSFNLFSVKMTDQAQMELIHIFDIILQTDICIMKECKTLNKVWVQFLNNDCDTHEVADIAKRNLLRNDECMMAVIHYFQTTLLQMSFRNSFDIFTSIRKFVNHFHHTVHKTELPSLALGNLLTNTCISLECVPLHRTGNKFRYGSRRFLQSNRTGNDIATCKLCYAMLMTKFGDYRLSLRIVNNVLSGITPFTIYSSDGVDNLFQTSDEAKSLYVDMFSGSATCIAERAKRAWLFDLNFMPFHMELVPAAIQIELIHCFQAFGVELSPFVCAQYLIFLNYCGLRQHVNRDRALRQLIDVVNNPEQRGYRAMHSYNIVGHCLLSVGETGKALDMFIRSYEFTLPIPSFHDYNSAHYYLQNLHSATNN